jgi:hypothetical protein
MTILDSAGGPAGHGVPTRRQADELATWQLVGVASTTPNVGLADKTVLVAMRRQPGEELTTDYRCGTASCRHTINGQDWRVRSCRASTAGTSPPSIQRPPEDALG